MSTTTHERPMTIDDVERLSTECWDSMLPLAELPQDARLAAIAAVRDEMLAPAYAWASVHCPAWCDAQRHNVADAREGVHHERRFGRASVYVAVDGDTGQPMRSGLYLSDTDNGEHTVESAEHLAADLLAAVAAYREHIVPMVAAQ